MRAGRFWRPVAATLAGLLALAALTAAPPAGAAANAYAPSIGTVTGTVATGSTGAAPTVVTTGACPAGTSAIQAFLDGGSLAQGVAIAADPVNVGNINTTGIPFSFSPLDVALNAGKALVNGTYDVSLVCDPGFGGAFTAQFDGRFTVSGAPTPTAAGTALTWAASSTANPTTTTLTTTPPGSQVVGNPVTLTATVAPAGAAGVVQFVDATSATPVNLGAPVPVAADGSASHTVNGLVAGLYTFTVAFTPTDPKAYSPSSAIPIGFTVRNPNQSLTTTTLTADPAIGVVRGGKATFTATVTPPQAAGTVAFADGSTTLTQAAVVGGVATVTVQPTTSGTLAVTAKFTPSDAAAYVGSTSASLTYTVADPLAEGTYVDSLVVMGPEVGTSEGVATAGLQLKAPQVCPAPAAGVTVRIAGPGAWALSIAVGSNGFYGTAGDSVLTDPLATAASAAGLQIVPGKYTIAATCRTSGATDATPTGFYLGWLWFYDSVHWMNQDPAVIGIPTTTTLTAVPDSVAVVKNKVELTATLTPSDSAGSVVFEAVSDTGTVTLGAGTVKAGKATLAVSDLELGLYYISATYTPDGSNATKHNGSRGADLIQAVVKAPPPTPTQAGTISGTPVVGSALTCRAGFSDVVSVSYQWFRDRALTTGTAAVRKLVAADAGHQLSCRVLATNSGGTVYRDSPAVAVHR